MGVLFYAGDTKLFIGFNRASEQSVVISKIERCLNDIKFFMNLNYLSKILIKICYFSIKTKGFKYTADG